MLVEEVMNKNPITISPTTTIFKALHLLKKHKIRHLPVLDQDRQLIGIVSDRDVRDASPSIFETDSNHLFLENDIQSIMSSPVITVHPFDFIEDIARIFYDREFASVPVVSNNKLVGIVTEKDMLYTLIQLTGTHVQSSHVEMKVKQRPGVLPEVTAIFGKRQVNIVSILIYPYKQESNYKTLVIRFQAMNPIPVYKDLRDAGFELLFPNHNMEPKI